MKALSVDMEYIYDIMDDKKTEEYRSWKTNYHGDLMLCATARSNATKKGIGALVVEIVGYRELPDGGYAWKLRNKRFIRPIEVHGRQRLFDVDDNLIVYDDHDPYDADYWDGVWDRYLDAHGVPA